MQCCIIISFDPDCRCCEVVLIIVLREVFSARQYIIRPGAIMLSPFRPSVCPSDGCIIEQESHAVAGKPRDAAVISDRYRVRWHFAGAISVSRMQSVSGCTVYA